MIDGKKLKTARVEKGLSQQELANLIGIDDGTLRKIESGVF